MTRAVKKKKELTLEEKLAEALVPVEKQPYKVPENWCWVYHNSILDISGGSQPAKSYFISECKEGYIQLYQTRDYGEHPVPVFIPEKYATKTTDEGDILLARYGGSLGKVFRAHKGAYNVALAKIIKLFPSILNDEYLYQYYLSHFYQEFCIKAASGRSAQSGFNRNDMEDLLFPLPPLPEQQRIVERIESLFSKLDEAKEKAQAVVDGFEDRKAAILHKAFTGELTEEWRRVNNLQIDSWKETFLQNICDKIFDGPFGSNLKSDDYIASGIRVVRLENLKNLWFDDSKQSFVSKEKYQAISKHTIFPTDLIMSTFTADEIKICQMPEYIKYAVNKADCIGIRIKDKTCRVFVKYYLSSRDTYNFLKKNVHGATRPRVNTKQIKMIPVCLPTIEEQRLIIQTIENCLQKEQQAKEAAEQVISQIDTMKKSILARAFRGELGTNDPADESAIELLKRVL